MSATAADRRQVFYEDIAVGQRFVTAGKTLSRSEILDFALRYDPRPQHNDATVDGGLTASPLHVMAESVGCIIREGVFDGTSLGASAMEDIRFLAPVRPGDTLTVHIDIADKRPSRSKPERGVIRLEQSVVNQRGEEVLTMACLQMIRRRHG